MTLQIQPGGLLRTLDDLGRLTLPADWRRHVGVKGGDQLEIIPCRDGSLVIQPYMTASLCVFCRSDAGVELISGRGMCATCLSSVRSDR